MKYRILGKTKLKVSEIGLGGIPIQRVTQNDVNEIIDTMIKTGANFIDTAVGYTTSEEMLGIALLGKREKFIIATKSMARTYDAMKNDIQNSLKRLKTDYIDLYQFHNLKSKQDYELVMSENGAYKALKEAKEEGIVKHVGITSHSADFLLHAIESNYFETIQFPYNFLEAQGEEVFELAHAKDIGVIAMKPMAGGVIDKGEVSLKYILQNKNITLAIPGMASRDEVIKNTDVSEHNDLSDCDNTYINEMKEKLKNDFCHRCGYCLPCTKSIDIPTLFTFELYHNVYNLKDWAKTRYDSLKVKAHECIECGACESRCPYHLKIMQRLKNIKNLFGK